jgi:hypothetical protein
MSKSIEEKIQKEMERYEHKFSDKEKETQLAEIKNKLEKLKNKPKPDYNDEIWAKIYEDVLELKKKSKK